MSAFIGPKGTLLLNEVGRPKKNKKKRNFQPINRDLLGIAKFLVVRYLGCSYNPFMSIYTNAIENLLIIRYIFR